MEYDGRIPIDGPSLSFSPSSFHHETLWQMNLGANETMEAVTYPVRDGETDCTYYIRTGLCRFGATCRFNHPPNRKLAIASARMMGEYPERPGQTECQYYLKTGTCKFGATCKFHHPRDRAGIAGQAPVNVLGLPLRPNEPECAYYSRTGQCKFGNTCKFHHPQLSNMMVPMRGSPVYPPPAQSPTPPGQQSYAGGLNNWPLMGASFIPSPRWQGPSNYAPLMLPQGVASMPAWKTYTGEPSSASSPDHHQQTQGNIQMYGQNEATNMGSQEGPISPYRSGSVPVGYYPMERESIFPERPGQPECQFYMKTGDCKFGGVCRFHHPRERLVPPPDCVLSPLGLPLRSGEPLCIFYTRYGICKFGPSCKFDHPMGVFAYNNANLSSAEASGVSHHLMRTSSGPSRLSLTSEALMDASSANPRRVSLSESRQMPSGDDNTVNTDE